MKAFVEAISQYPFDPRVPSPRRTIIVGKKQDGELRGELVKVSGIAQRKRGLISGQDRISPPVQSDEERGEGDSTNAKMHRILYG